jgi:hypothetical protein
MEEVRYGVKSVESLESGYAQILTIRTSSRDAAVKIT